MGPTRDLFCFHSALHCSGPLESATSSPFGFGRHSPNKYKSGVPDGGCPKHSFWCSTVLKFMFAIVGFDDCCCGPRMRFWFYCAPNCLACRLYPLLLPVVEYSVGHQARTRTMIYLSIQLAQVDVVYRFMTWTELCLDSGRNRIAVWWRTMCRMTNECFLFVEQSEGSESKKETTIRMDSVD